MKNFLFKIVVCALVAIPAIGCKPRKSARLSSSNNEERQLDSFLKNLPPYQKNLFKQDLVAEQLISSVLMLPDLIAQNCSLVEKDDDKGAESRQANIASEICRDLLKRHELLLSDPKDENSTPQMIELAEIEELIQQVDEPVIRWRLAMGYLEIANSYSQNKALVARAAKFAQTALDPRKGMTPTAIKNAPVPGRDPNKSPSQAVNFCISYHECHMYLSHLELISRLRPEILIGTNSPVSNFIQWIDQNVGFENQILHNLLWAQAKYIALRAQFFHEARISHVDGITFQFTNNPGSLSTLREEVKNLRSQYRERLSLFMDNNGRLVPEAVKVAKCEVRLVDLKDERIDYDPDAKVDSCNKEEAAKDEYIKAAVSEFGKSIFLFDQRLEAFLLYLERVSMVNRNGGQVSPRPWFAQLRQRLSSQGEDKVRAESALLAFIDYFPVFESTLPWRDLWLQEAEYYFSILDKTSTPPEMLSFYENSKAEMRDLVARVQVSLSTQLEKYNLPKWLADPAKERILAEEIPERYQNSQSEKIVSFARNFHSTQYQLSIFNKSLLARNLWIQSMNEAGQARKNIDPEIAQINDQNFIDGLLQPWGKILCYSYYSNGRSEFSAKSPLDQGGLGWTGLGTWSAKEVCELTASEYSDLNSTISASIGRKIVYNRKWSNGIYETIGPALVDCAFTIASGSLMMSFMPVLGTGIAKVGLDSALKKFAIQSAKAGAKKIAEGTGITIGKQVVRYTAKAMFTALNQGVIAAGMYYGPVMLTSIGSGYIRMSMQARGLQGPELIARLLKQHVLNVRALGMTWLNLWVFSNTDIFINGKLRRNVDQPIANLAKRVQAKDVEIDLDLVFSVKNAPKYYTKTVFTFNTLVDLSTVDLVQGIAMLPVQIIGNISQGAPWLEGTNKILRERLLPAIGTFSEGALMSAMMTQSMTRIKQYQADMTLRSVYTSSK